MSPYIKKEDRPDIEDIVDVYAYKLKCDGHLNFFICKLFLKLMRINGGIRYNKAKEFIGEFRVCQNLEIYRKFIHHMRMKRRQKNGKARIILKFPFLSQCGESIKNIYQDVLNQ